MRPAPGEVLHFSEDPLLVSFEPREGAVWAVGADRAQDYWFPRDCPRLLAWVSARTTAAHRHAYRLPAGPFAPAPGDPSPSLVASVVGTTLEFSGIRLRNALPREV